MDQDTNTPATKDDDPVAQHHHPEGAQSHTAGDSESGGQVPQSTTTGALSHEDALKELEKVRKEAARYRTERNELQGAANKWKEHEDAQKSDLERTQEQLAEVQEKLKVAEASKVLLEVAAEHGIKPEDMALLGTGTKEELEPRAARIKELYGSAHTTPPSQQPRQNLAPGSGVGDKETTGEAMYPSSWVPDALRENKTK